ncbi:hypothetical protein [uncultured Olleya sp.]|uniref:hypothetical protein n=1 Tax=uncultured Olleya sp. TaxID=757243 RepID=UPI0032B20C2D|tara:strand:+ start:2037 stop:3086 length:1050 start_codon:yes stop_codon:yes gene_type:complete
MNRYSTLYNQYELTEQIELLRSAFLILLCVLVLVIIRNWYNLYKKRSFRKNNRLLKEKLDAQQLNISKFDQQLRKTESLERKLNKKVTEIFQLEKEMEDYKQKFYSYLSEKEKEIAQHKETNNYQKRAYERFVDYKNVEANNTRLGAHFIKNVISQIYKDIEETDNSYKSFLGINYKRGAKKSKVPPIKALKNIFKLLDYNVSALNKEHTTLEEELAHINMFLDLIKYLKPNTNINFSNKLNSEQNSSIKIKPTLFFPFVENALKHGALNNVDSFISIILKENDDKQLSYCLVNSAEQRLDYDSKVSQSSNFGLNALQQLLNAYYPKSKLEHKTLPNNQYLSELTLSLN